MEFGMHKPNSAGGNLSGTACAPQPNCRFNADANTGHAFGIFMASVGALRAPAPVNLGVMRQPS
jgi:hypothetical protein